MTVKADAVASGPGVPKGLSAEVARLQAQFEGVQLTGEGGLLADMIKQAVEAALQGDVLQWQRAVRRRSHQHV